MNWEHWSPRVPVSGGVRAGIMVESSGRLDPQRITVFLPESSAPLLCLEVSTHDGRYSAKREYPVAGVPAGPLTLEFPTTHAADLATFEPNQVAVLAGLAERCDEPASTYLVATWLARSLGDRVAVLLNSRVPTTIVGGQDGRIEHEAPCVALSGATTAFNLRCELQTSWLTPGTEFFVRMRRGRSFATVPLPIAVQR